MRIGIDYRPALVNREGIGRYTRELVRALIELGLDRDLGLFGYTLSPARFTRDELGLAGSRAELVRLRLPSRWSAALMQRLDRGADDLVGGASVFHHTQPHLLPVRAAAEVGTLYDCIFLLDAGYLDPAVAARMEAAARELVRRARRILVPSEFVGAEVVLSFGVAPARVTVTPLGCDHVARSLPPEGFPPASEPYVLTVSRVDARKNHLRMLEAFERLVREGLPQRWLIAGPRGYGAELFERELERSPARGRVEWREAVPDAELPRLYAQADAFLFSSLNEGFGLPPLEAMACGAPVVTSSVTSLPEVCGDAALLVEPTDSGAIFEALRSVLVDRELAAELRLRGRERARRFTWRECARKTLAAYRAAEQPEERGPLVRRSL
ncbi:MAG TPA: glycosyltransferase family 1 protein [Planctomycetota bacterium]|nr:glycosyltransferase family 1 protein [Planctomycetota bacterium]